MKRNFTIFLIAFSCLFSSPQLFAQPQRSMSASEIQLALKKLNTVGSVLYIAAHPDDENTRLLSYLANERLVRTGYLSLTRGDGGQNLIGSEQSELLGIIRTQELLAARRTDGAEQFFTRANDFGYSKNPEETFSIWDKEKILADVVWVIRNFKPDVIITRFPTNGDGGHGHHTASAILAEEAFEAAADPNRFPEQLAYVKTWQTQRLFWNAFVRDPKADVSGFLKIETGIYNTLLGKSYGEISAKSRSMHKSQGFGVPANRLSTPEYFKLIKGNSAPNDLLENINTTWSRVSGSEKLASLIQQAYLEFKPESPATTMPLLIQAYDEVDNIKDDYWRMVKEKEIEQLLLACSGTWLEANAAEYSVVPGNPIKITASAVCRTTSGWQLEAISFPGIRDTLINKSLTNYQSLVVEKNIVVPTDVPTTQPYWLKEKHGPGIFEVSDPLLIGTPENTAPLQVKFIFRNNNIQFTFIRPVQFKWTDDVEGELYRNLEIIPAVTLSAEEKTYVFTDKRPQEIKVVLKAGMNGVKGMARLNLPAGWKSTPAAVPFDITGKGQEQIVIFNVSPTTASHSSERFEAIAEVNGTVFNQGMTSIKYNHIPVQTLFPESSGKLIQLDIVKKGKRIGYIPGAGDGVAQCLKKIGYDVTLLTDELIERKTLNEYDAIVVGIRAYNTNERMDFYRQKLMDYMQQGGTVVVQYNTNNFISSVKNNIGPYPYKISRDRVTREDAPITFEIPEHPVLNTPNKITSADFDNWIQERGIYFATEWDSHYQTPLSCHDPGEQALKGSTIIAPYGKGYYVYTGLAFFRELPAGVPGAYRLFVNMISLGK